MYRAKVGKGGILVSTSQIGLSVTAQKGDYIGEKFGSVGVIYLELRA